MDRRLGAGITETFFDHPEPADFIDPRYDAAKREQILTNAESIRVVR